MGDIKEAVEEDGGTLFTSEYCLGRLKMMGEGTNSGVKIAVIQSVTTCVLY